MKHIKRLRRFLHCNNTWLSFVVLISLLIHNFCSEYEASQFSLFANLLIGALVYSGYLTNCEVKRDKKDDDDNHTK